MYGDGKIAMSHQMRTFLAQRNAFENVDDDDSAISTAQVENIGDDFYSMLHRVFHKARWGLKLWQVDDRSTFDMKSCYHKT